jgi:ubiquinone biosynthesis protein COQ4
VTTHPATAEIAPAPPPRPIRWRRLWRLVREIAADPERTENVFEILDCVGGRGNEPSFQAFVANPACLALLRRRSSLVHFLADRAALAALPEGSLGRAYYAFAEARKFPAAGLLDLNDAVRVEGEEDVDPDRRWYYDRLTVMHDLWHVLTGYGTDSLGEAALLAFTQAQIPSRGIRLLLWVGAAIGPWGDRLAFQRFLLRAWRRGRRARRLDQAHFELLLAEPLEDVRRALCIEPAARAHPRGIAQAVGNDIRWVPAGQAL